MFEIGKVYNKKQLHEQFGAQEIKDMVTQKSFYPVFIVTGDDGEVYDEGNEWNSEDTYVYTDYSLKNRIYFENKEHDIENSHVYLFKGINEDKVKFENKLKLIKLKVETGYDEEGSYTQRIKYELKK